jgi:hypothetical protein
MVGVDLTGPLQLSGGFGKVFTATAIDYLTKWVEEKIITNKKAPPTARFSKEKTWLSWLSPNRRHLQWHGMAG